MDPEKRPTMESREALLARGARVVMGGDPDPGQPGFFYPKTLIADIDNDAGPARVGQRLIVSPVQIPDEPVCVMSVCHPSLGPGGEKLPVLNEWPLPLAAAYAVGRVDLAPTRADKAAGVTRALAEVGVDPLDAIAFGDAPPDIPMFELAATASRWRTGIPT